MPGWPVSAGGDGAATVSGLMTFGKLEGPVLERFVAGFAVAVVVVVVAAVEAIEKVCYVS